MKSFGQGDTALRAWRGRRFGRGFRISTPAGFRPAIRARSTAHSVCPARRSTPPSLATSGKRCPGPDEVGRLALGIEDFADRFGPLRRGDASAAMAVIHRHGEGGAQGGGIVFDDGRQVQPLGHLGQDGHAELPPPVGDHEIDDFGRDLLGRADEIALVFAVLVVHRDDDAAGREGLDGRFDGGKPVRHLSLLAGSRRVAGTRRAPVTLPTTPLYPLGGFSPAVGQGSPVSRPVAPRWVRPGLGISGRTNRLHRNRLSANP